MTELVVNIKRTFQAPIEAVYRAWTDPTQVRQWWCTPGFEFQDIAMEVTPGGVYRYDVLAGTGTEVVLCIVDGHFTEVEAPRKLVYTWTMQAPGVHEKDTVVSVLFEEDGAQTRLTLTHDKFVTPEVFNIHNMDWPIVLNNLETLLKQPAPATKS